MKPERMSALMAMLLAGATALAVVASTVAVAQTGSGEPLDLMPQASAKRSAFIQATEWSIDRTLKTAVVLARSPSGGIFAGVQCDPFDPRSRRLILGAVQSVDRNGLAAEMRASRPARFKVGVGTASTYSEFFTFAEDRGKMDLGMPAEFAAAYLTSDQYELLKSANAFTVAIGQRTYSFTGRGSLAKINALSCEGTKVTVASRTIPGRQSEPPRPVQTPWKFLSHTGAAALVKGTAEAFTTVANFPNNELASFQLRITCLDGRLFARFSGGAVAKAVDDPRALATQAFVRSVDNRRNVVEIYRGEARVAAFSVDGIGSAWKGHPISYDEVSALFDFDRVVVNGGDVAVQFDSSNAAAAMVDLAQTCGASI